MANRNIAVQIFIVFFINISVFIAFTAAITTTHHDKPNEANIAAMALKMKEEASRNSSYNSTLPASERQKRLLPYYNFYLANGFNQPAQQHQVAGNNQKYQIVVPKITNYQPFQNKYELTPLNQQPKLPDNQNILYQQKGKFTPFMESNALPGPFVPMVRNQQPIEQINYNPAPQQYKIHKVPNYAAIYDKLSQLKLIQQNLASRPQTYTQNYRVNTPPPYAGQNQAAKQQVNYIPIRQYHQEVTNQQQYKTVEPTKTIVHTYTPTNIDIPSNNEQYNKPVQHTISVPTKNIYPVVQQKVKPESIPKPYIREHIAVQHQDHVQPLTLEDHKQYIEDQKQFTEIKRKPIIILQRVPPQSHKQLRIPAQKPIQLQPIIYQENIHQEPQKSPIIYVSQKPYQPEVHKEETYITPLPQPKLEAQKFVTVQPQNFNPPIQKIEQPQIVEYEKYEPEYQNVVSERPIEVVTENSNSLSVILKRLQDSNALPQTLTPDNIDNSIKTLVKILTALKNQQSFTKPIIVPEEVAVDYDNNEADININGYNGDVPGSVTQIFPALAPEGGTPGKAGIDYPALSSIPPTSFNCKTQRYKGFFGDPDTHCQVWHYCDLNGGQASFLCPNGTIFSQVALTCDWWYNVKCSSTAQLYVLNERLYKYILPFSPKFPEDYSGPLVDKYLALKFKEMEEKMQKQKKGKQSEDEEEEEIDDEESNEAKKDVSQSESSIEDSTEDGNISTTEEIEQ